MTKAARNWRIAILLVVLLGVAGVFAYRVIAGPPTVSSTCPPSLTCPSSTECPPDGLSDKEGNKECPYKKNSEKKAATAGAEGEALIPGDTKTDETIVTDYVVGKTVEQKVDMPGDIISLSVAAVVDLSVGDANEAGGAGEAAAIMTLDDVKELIKNALGLKETDLLKVVEARFHRPIEALVEEEPSPWPRYMTIARQASLGITAICGLLVLWIFRGAKKKASSAATAEQLAGAEPAAGLLPAGSAGSAGSGSLMVRKQIADALQNNPAMVRELFLNWLEERG